MPFSSSTELLDWLSKNLLLNADQVNQLRGLTQDGDLHGFCKELLRRDWLTPFQINQIIKNDGDNLVLGANRLYSRLGEGSMGQVYKAWNVRLGRMVAVKILHPDHALSAKAMDRFRREMQTAAALDHPNIVLLRDADEHNGVPYLVMDFFDGIDLSKKVRQDGPQPVAQSVEWIRQAALGLQHAFGRGVVHRDIKPSNLLLVKTSDGRSVIKVLDFGLAKFERETVGDQTLTQAGRLIGTVDYIAPEQAVDAHNADVRADIYSLGCTLFYLLTAKAPFAGKDHLEKLSARIQGDPPRLCDLRPDAPAELEDVLARMMARQPEDRYQMPQEAAAALSAFCPMMAMALPASSRVVATPVAAAPVAVEEMEDSNPFGYGGAAGIGAATSLDSEVADEAPPRNRPRDESDDDEPAPRSGRTPLLIGAIGLVMLLAIGGLAAYFLWPKGTAIEMPPAGTMTLSLDSPPDKVWNWNHHGKKRSIIVKVKRNNFTGPVTVSVENPPDWLQALPFTVTASKNVGEFQTIVKTYAPQGPYVMKIVATAPNSQPASVDYEMEIIPHVATKPKPPPPPPPEDEKKKDEKKDQPKSD